MNKLQQLREKRNKLMADAAKLIEQENLTTEHRTQADAMLADVDIVEADISREERVAKYEAEQRATTRPPRPGFSVDQEADTEKRAFSDFIRYGRVEQRDLGVGPVAGTITGGSQFVPQLFDPVLVSARKAVGQVISAVNVRKTDSGAAMKIALENDTALGVTVVGESAGVTEADPSLASKMSGVDKITTGLVKVSLEELEDSAFNIDAFIRDKFFKRYLRGVSKLIVQGSTNVESIVTTATSAGTAAATNMLTYTDLLKLWAGLDPEYQANASFLLNSSTRAALMGQLDTLGRPIFVPSTTAGAPDTLIGRPILLSQHLDNMGAGTTPVLFGDFTEGYTLRTVGDLQVFRLDQLYLPSEGVIGFTAFARVGGYATDAGTHPIQSLQMKAT